MTKHKSHEHKADAKPQAETAKPQVEGVKPQAEEDSTARLNAELQAAKDRELRCRAELDNYRKRAARELEEQNRYANMSLLRDLLPVLDNVERAIQAVEQHSGAAAPLDDFPSRLDNSAALLDGFKMVQQQLEEVLKSHACLRIEALHAPFDPHLHHAVMQQPSDEHPANTVLIVTQNGYQLHDRVVRPSQVIVSTAK